MKGVASAAQAVVDEAVKAASAPATRPPTPKGSGEAKSTADPA
jgi:hypothetical protein